MIAKLDLLSEIFKPEKHLEWARIDGTDAPRLVKE
jgi:hypothetical protein